MLNNVIAGIAIALNQEFGDDYEIYTEEIKQDLKEPCFFITPLNPSKTDFPSKRYLMDNPFCIQYFPKSEDNPNSECRDVADRMLWALENTTPLDADRPIRGTDMHHEITDGVLNFFVNYNYFVRKVETPAPLMETMTTVLHLKG